MNTNASAASGLPDYDLPGNDLDPKTPTPEERKRIPRIYKVYGALCLIDGIVALPLIVLLIAVVGIVLATSPEELSIAADPTLTVVVTAINVILTLVASVLLIRFGLSLIKNQRRNAALWSEALIAITLAQILANIMLNGLGIVLSPANNQGYLPGMNAGAFNLGAGISFAILFAVSTAFSDNGGGYAAGMWAGVIILVLAFLCSLLIPRPESITDTVAAKVQAEEAAQAAS